MTHVIAEIARELVRQFKILRVTQPRYYAAISVALAFVCCIAAWGTIAATLRTISWLRRPSARTLTDTALSANQSEATKAAQDLDRMALGGEIDIALIRRLAKEAGDESVRAIAFSRLASVWDYDSMPLFLESLNADSPALRRSSAKAVAKLLGRDHHFPVDGTHKERADKLARIVKDWEAYEDSRLFQLNKERLRAVSK